MFSTNATTATIAEEKSSATNSRVPYMPSTPVTETMNFNAIDTLLEKEKQHNKTESWNKLDKTVKRQKLSVFADKYGVEHNYNATEIKELAIFLIDSLDKGKLQKAKDVVFEKESREIFSIPALHFNGEKRQFTLRIVDSKRVSTLKSLTPKRIAESK